MREEASDFDGPEGSIVLSGAERVTLKVDQVQDDKHYDGGEAWSEHRRRWNRSSRLKALAVCVAGAVIFAIFSKLRVAGRGLLPLHMEEDGYYEAFLRSPFSGKPSGSTAKSADQEHVKIEDESTAEGQEDASPSPSEATAIPSPAEDQLPLRDSWGFPMLDQFEETLPPDCKEGKAEMAAYFAKGISNRLPPSKIDRDLLSATAKMLSNGLSDELIGMIVPLKDVNPFHLMEKDGSQPSSVRINKFLGRGGSALVVEAEDTDTGEVYAMRFTFAGEDVLKWYKRDDSCFGDLQTALNVEERGARQLCGSIPANMMASKKGIAVPLYTANVAGGPKGKRVGDYYILGHVQLSEKLGDNLMQFLTSGADVKKVREYMGRRLLQIILKIQQAGVSHNDLKWENMLLCPDGSFVVADLGSVIPFGTRWGDMMRYTESYREPQLNLADIPEAYEKQFKHPHASSDLWSVGVLLYELFTEHKCPFSKLGIPDKKNKNNDPLSAKKNVEAMKTRDIERGLAEDDVPPIWADLISSLLVPSTERRLTIWELMNQFPELFN